MTFLKICLILLIKEVVTIATFQERLEEALILRQKTAADLSRETGISDGAISQYRKGAYKATQRNLEKIADALHVSIPWLMGISDDLSGSNRSDFDIFSIPGVSPMPETRKIPLLGTIACGTPILAAENLDGEVDIPKSIHADFALICRGDSMIGARIHDGDVVYIRQQPTVENGEIAAVLIGDEATLKRVYIYPDQLVLNAENPIYAPMIYAGDNRDAILILGKAVGFTSAEI